MKVRRLPMAIQELREGMRLGADVPGAGGGVLLAAGAVLDDEVLAGLRRRGVETVIVELPDLRSGEEIDRQRTQAEARIRHLFRRSGEAPQMDELMRFVLDYRRRVLS